MWSSTTTTSSTLPSHCLANMPIVAEPQPTRMRSSCTPSTTGGLPAWTTTLAPSSICNSTALPLHKFNSESHVAVPSCRLPPVQCPTPPSDSICEPYSLVVTWPTASPCARTVLHSAPKRRPVAIFTLPPQ